MKIPQRNKEHKVIDIALCASRLCGTKFYRPLIFFFRRVVLDRVYKEHDRLAPCLTIAIGSCYRISVHIERLYRPDKAGHEAGLVILSCCNAGISAGFNDLVWIWHLALICVFLKIRLKRHLWPPDILCGPNYLLIQQRLVGTQRLHGCLVLEYLKHLNAVGNRVDQARRYWRPTKGDGGLGCLAI